MREAGLATMNDTQAPLKRELRNGNPHEAAAGDLRADREAGNERDPAAQLDKALDGFKRGEFDTHVERSFVLLEGLDDLLTEGRGDGVGDEVAGTEIADGNLARAGEGMAGIDDKGQIVAIDDGGGELRVVGAEGEQAELDAVQQHLVRDAAGERALHGDLDAAVSFAELRQQRKQVEAGVFVGGDAEFAGVESAKIANGTDGFRAEIEHFKGVFAQDLPAAVSVPSRELRSNSTSPSSASSLAMA